MKKQSPIPPKLKFLVREYVKKHAWYIGVSHFTVDIMYMVDDKKSERGGDVVASMATDLSYLTGTLCIYPYLIERWKKDGDVFLEEAIAHEVSHMATEKLYYIGTARYINDGEIESAREELTTTVARLSMELSQRNKELKKLNNIKHDKKSRNSSVRKPAKSSVKHKVGKKKRQGICV